MPSFNTFPRKFPPRGGGGVSRVVVGDSISLGLLPTCGDAAASHGAGIGGASAAAGTAARLRLIKVGQGGFIFLCVQRLPAAQGFPMGTRLSLQSFLTFDKGKALILEI